MTAHDHTEIVEGCFRCELSADELNPAFDWPRLAPIDEVQRAISEFETFTAADGIRSIRMRDSRTLPEVAQAAINATLLGDWLVDAIHRGVCEDSPEECRSEGRGACVRGAAALREAGIRRP